MGTSFVWGAPRDEERFRQIRPAIVGIACKAPSAVRTRDGDLQYEGGQTKYFGTGTIFHPNGYVLTSTTVTPPGATEIWVYHSDRRKAMPASLIGTEVSLELALLKIDVEEAVHLPIRDSHDTVPGERVYTAGNAHHLIFQNGMPLFSAGILSGRYALEQAYDLSSYRGEVLETTASMSPGSNGGALIASDGAILGILSLNVSSHRWLGTAIPSQRWLPTLRKWLEKEGADLPKSLPSKRDTFPWKQTARSLVSVQVVRNGGKPVRRKPNLRTRPDGEITGIVLDEEGHILTSFWNVQGRVHSIEVRFGEGKVVRARLIAHDPNGDLALLKAEERLDIPPIRWGGRDFRFGDPVFLLGCSPVSEHRNVTDGVVSAVPIPGKTVQVEAPVNYGNAGGVAVNAQGEAIGVVVKVRNNVLWGQNSGIGFVMPAKNIQSILEEWDMQAAFQALEESGKEEPGDFRERNKLQEVVEKVRPAYVFIKGRNPANPRRSPVGGGAVIREDGLVVTCEHVVHATGMHNGCEVTFADGRSYAAKVLGVDPFMDIALLKIQSEESFPFLPMGNSEALVPGEDVIVLGTPFGMGFHERRLTVGLGVVRGLHADLELYRNSVLIDAPLNPADSGGPLINMKGELVGVNGYIVTRFGYKTSTGVGMSVSTTQIRRFLDVLERGETVRHARLLGIRWSAEPCNWGKGMSVKEVVSGSRAQRGGIQAGDRIIRVGGYSFVSEPGFHSLVSTFPADQPLSITVSRKGKELDLEVSPRSGSPPWHMNPGTFRAQKRRLQLGFRWDVVEGKGLIVREVRTGSPAARAGVEPGDRIRMLDGYDVLEPDDLDHILVRHRSGDSVPLKVERDGKMEIFSFPVTFSSKMRLR